MISINYQAYGKKGFHLRLRFYQKGETKFIDVTRFLKGDVQKRHWNRTKQIFTPSCPYVEMNNDFLVRFKKKYEDLALNWNGTLYGLITAVDSPKDDSLTLYSYLQSWGTKLKENRHNDGTLKGTWEEYEKLSRRLSEFCEAKGVKYEKILLSEINAKIVDNILNWVRTSRNGRGLRYISKTLHALIMKADKAGFLNADDFKRCDWEKGVQVSNNKYHTLTDNQIKKFKSLDLDKIAPSPKNELYRDFCIFLLLTGQSPCDAMTLKYSDIEEVYGFSHFMFKRRKIGARQLNECAIPINGEMQAIMDRWRDKSKDKHIFPIRDKAKNMERYLNNLDIKHFGMDVNRWLKNIGPKIGCKFELHLYTFRHTAITRYVSQGVPLPTIALMMGTSVKNIERIYYNNLGDISSRNKILQAMNL